LIEYTEQLKILNAKLDSLNDLQYSYEKKNAIKFNNKINLPFIKQLYTKPIMDFKNINTLDELYYKIDRDLEIFKKLFK
jgi:hypothetical protein